ncbi:FAD-dependent monooxygenase [Streptomyces xinghaiensis]
MTAKRLVLISGAGIAGPALAYWLHRSGCAVTVVEKAGGLRDGGYPIDIRGTATEVVRGMGVLPRLRDAHIDSRRFTFLDADGSEVALVDPRALAGDAGAQDLEGRRGDLAALLHALVRGDVEFLFDDCIDTLDQHEHGVDVMFRSGRRRTFDPVVGADGRSSGAGSRSGTCNARFRRNRRAGRITKAGRTASPLGATGSAHVGTRRALVSRHRVCTDE